jgi:hypothetical protein
MACLAWRQRRIFRVVNRGRRHDRHHRRQRGRIAQQFPLRRSFFGIQRFRGGPVMLLDLRRQSVARVVGQVAAFFAIVGSGGVVSDGSSQIKICGPFSRANSAASVAGNWRRPHLRSIHLVCQANRVVLFFSRQGIAGAAASHVGIRRAPQIGRRRLGVGDGLPCVGVTNLVSKVPGSTPPRPRRRCFPGQRDARFRRQSVHGGWSGPQSRSFLFYAWRQPRLLPDNPIAHKTPFRPGLRELDRLPEK